MDLEAFRRAFSQTTEHGIYFDNASMGPVAPQVTRAMTQCMEQRQTMPMQYYKFAEKVFPVCKGLLAGMIGSDPQDIAFTENVAYGINCAARSLPLKRGDNVVLCNREFASNIYPWLCLQQDTGVEVRIVPNDGGTLTVDRLAQYADAHTRAVTVSSVQFSDGAAADLEALGSWCQVHGAYFVVDCAQSLGVMPMDVKNYHIDFLAGLASKWLLGPFSTGFLYIRRELAQRLQPGLAGADSVKGDVDATDYKLEWKDGADRFELGLPNAPGIAGLCASLELLDQVGFDAIHDRAWALSGYFAGKLREAGIQLAPCLESDKTRSTIVSFVLPELEEARLYFRERNLYCSVRGGYLRMGIHGYNSYDEADRALEIIRRYRE